MKPTLGRIVLYRYSLGQFPAIVSKINEDGTIGVHVFTWQGVYAGDAAGFTRFDWVVEDPTGEAWNSWSWPPR